MRVDIKLSFSEQDARTITHYLQRKYKTKKGLPKLAMIAIRTAVAEEAKKELGELGIDLPG